MKEIKTQNGFVILVDDDDYPLLSRWTWRASKASRSFYAMTTIRNNSVSMHQLIIGPQGKRVIDHIDGNGLNNTKENLRLCSIAHNVQNRHYQSKKHSVFRGVCKRRNKWCAYGKKPSAIGSQRSSYLGQFDIEIDAAIAYDIASIKTYGKECFTNFKSLMSDDQRIYARDQIERAMRELDDDSI